MAEGLIILQAANFPKIIYQLHDQLMLSRGM